LGTAVALEILQRFAPGRDPRVIDAVEKLAGGALGILIARMLLVYRADKTR
jgi:VanZ family protein